MKAIVLTNPSAGAKTDPASDLHHVLTFAGVDADVREVPGDQITAAARDAVNEKPDAVVAAGGDGTVSAVASALAGTPIPLGVLPTGTLNHFARDLNIPTALPEAARTIATGNLVSIDVAEVNGRTFINNSSIGVYPHIVGERDRQRQQLGRGKWLAMVIAAIAIFRRHPTYDVRIEADETTLLRNTPFIFVGNNRYQMSMTTLGTRQRIDGGELSLYLSHRSGRFALLRLAVRAVLGRLEQSKDFATMTATQVRIDSHRSSLRVALDGEVTRMSPPLDYQIRPAALRVIVPSEKAQGQPG